MPDASSNLKAPQPLVAIAGWLVPGAGYWMIGQRQRALAAGVAVIAIYLAGLLIGGVRVVEVPGFNERGHRIQTPTPSGPMWVMAAEPLAEIKAKPWSIAQVLAGPLGIASGAVSVATAGTAFISHTPVNEAGTLYTAVAGMLNLLVIIDATHRAASPDESGDDEDDDRTAASASKEAA